MAGGTFLALLDDITAVLDDVAAMTNVAAKKTAGVLGDDLALNAQQVSGVRANRELPVVWAVAKGSALNKLILVPVALLISAFLPKLVTPLLMIGGAYLCFEGVEKLFHKYFHSAAEDAAHHDEHVAHLAMNDEQLVALEKDKIKGAIRTDFILSAEIIVIALETVANAPMGQRIAVLAGIAALMTVGVYGLVAGIVKLDDAGLALTKKSNSAVQALGRGLLAFAPMLMRFLSIAGTAAMFLVGGGILVHGVPALHHWVESVTQGMSKWLQVLSSSAFDGVIGVIAGIVVLAVVLTFKRVFAKP